MYFRGIHVLAMRVVVVDVLLLWPPPQTHALVLPPITPGMQCEICNSSSYCFNEVQSMCPFNSRAPPGSSVVADCVCDGGYYEAYNALSYGHQCVMCDPGYFCAVGGRTRCPDDMHSDAFTDNSEACYCNAGFAFVD